MWQDLLWKKFFRQIKKIEQNDGKLLGSKSLGNICLWLMNPAGKLSQKINTALDQPIIQSSKSQAVVGRKTTIAGMQVNYLGLGLRLTFEF